MLLRILLAIDSNASARRLERLLAQPNVAVARTASEGGLWEGLGRESCDVVVVDRSGLPGAAGDVVSAIRKLPDRPEVIVLQHHEDTADRAALLSAGCLGVVSRELSDAVLAQTLTALMQRRWESVVTRLRAEHSPGEYRLTDFATDSPSMQRLVATARRVAASDSSLLILGETGVGKEWLARAIHAESRRAAAPLIAVNCAAIPDTLLESELFGHEKGAFTGAIRSRRGHFELAHRGTLFLDEIGDMSPQLQAKLLRVLQERKIQRVGAEQSIEVDVRVMAATHRDLEAEMETKTFRRDLYYRLGVVTLTIPPLRERREDVPALAHAYLDRFRVRLVRAQPQPLASVLAPEVVAALCAYDWPGNVRELINVMERAVLLAQGPELTRDDLPDNIARPKRPEVSLPLVGPLDPAIRENWLDKPLRVVRREVVEAAERAYLVALLDRTGGRIGETARRAGLDPRSLYDKMKQLGLRKEDYKGTPESGSELPEPVSAQTRRSPS